MARKQQDTSATEHIFASGDAAMKHLEEAGFGPVRWMGLAWFETMSELNSEMLSFLASRVREDVRIQHALLHCKSVDELRQIQTRFLEKAYRQYADETGKLMTIGIDMLPLTIKGTKGTPV